jgi:hypothetical protein
MDSEERTPQRQSKVLLIRGRRTRPGRLLVDQPRRIPNTKPNTVPNLIAESVVLVAGNSSLTSQPCQAGGYNMSGSIVLPETSHDAAEDGVR